jgi:hypothetical protein
MSTMARTLKLPFLRLNQAKAEEFTYLQILQPLWPKTLSRPTATTREKAFQTILKNRTYHGGILAPGSAPGE